MQVLLKLINGQVKVKFFFVVNRIMNRHHPCHLLQTDIVFLTNMIKYVFGQLIFNENWN